MNLNDYKRESEEFWISISDLMSGLMVIFMFIAVAYISDIATQYHDVRSKLYADLMEEFKDDLDEWGVEIIDSTLTVRFLEPDILFEQGDTEIRPRFAAILDDFFPRYLKILTRPEYIDEISEVRIEGHTSSEWAGRADTSLVAYVNNMELSQGRTRAVLYHILSHESSQERFSWLKPNLTANGLSSSQTIVDVEGREDRIRSRRVDFRIVTNAESRILEFFVGGGS